MSGTDVFDERHFDELDNLIKGWLYLHNTYYRSVEGTNGFLEALSDPEVADRCAARAGETAKELQFKLQRQQQQAAAMGLAKLGVELRDRVPGPPPGTVQAQLRPEAAEALMAEEFVSQLSEGEIVDRAVYIYHSLMEEVRKGHRLLLRDKNTGLLSGLNIVDAD